MDPKDIPRIRCPACGKLAHRTNTKYGIRDACYECDLHSWAGKPLTTKETMAARNAAHVAFDSLWEKEKLCSRSKAYKLLTKELGAKYQVHMAQMDLETATKVPPAVDRIRTRLTEEDQTRETPKDNQNWQESANYPAKNRPNNPKQEEVDTRMQAPNPNNDALYNPSQDPKDRQKNPSNVIITDFTSEEERTEALERLKSHFQK